MSHILFALHSNVVCIYAHFIIVDWTAVTEYRFVYTLSCF